MNSNNTGISTEDIFSIREVLKKNTKISKAILFGSRAKGTYKTGSDIDIALSGEELVLNDILDVSNELQALNLPYVFDVVILERISEVPLLEHIQRVGIEIHSRL